MEELEKWKNWLLGFEALGALCTDRTDPGLGSTGLFPLGCKVLHRQEDVVGNRYVRYWAACQLRRVDTTATGACWMSELTRWVQQQNALGNTPGLGNIPNREIVSAENGRLQKHDSGGTATYCIDLLTEYTLVYPATATE